MLRNGAGYKVACASQVAPKTYKHILKLAELGAYDTNHFFRVDKGFVAQVQSCGHGRQVPLNEEQQVLQLVVFIYSSIIISRILQFPHIDGYKCLV